MADGVQFDRKSAERISRVVRQVESAPPGPNRWGSPHLRGHDDTVPIYNGSGYTIPPYGVVWLPFRDGANYRFNGYRPPHPGLINIGIATAEILNGAEGLCWTSGIHRVYYPGTSPAVSAGTRAGATRNSFAWKHDTLGPLFYVGVETEGAQTYALFDLRRERGDWLLVGREAARIYGVRYSRSALPIQTLCFGPEWTVWTDDPNALPGVVKVRYDG